jgi:hypothetical protein
MSKLVYSMMVILLGGCSARISPAQRLDLDQFVGVPTATLIAELGPPHVVHRSQGLADLTFVSNRTVLVPAETGYVYPGVNVRATAWLDSRQCDMTFRVKNDTVVAWSVSGNECSGMPLPSRSTTGARHSCATNAQRSDAENVSSMFQPTPVLGSLIVRKGQFYTQ